MAGENQTPGQVTDIKVIGHGGQVLLHMPDPVLTEDGQLERVPAHNIHPDEVKEITLTFEDGSTVIMPSAKSDDLK